MVKAMPPMWGSSPREQGKQHQLLQSRPKEGLIPAHAGKTNAGRLGFLQRADHPRSRGENRAWAYRAIKRYGSSPLTRGKPIPG